ncbi:MAG: UDP-N-acetylmuramoyl-L-alanine--D-glutamate ligase, partial [Myxococcota bacterium]
LGVQGLSAARFLHARGARLLLADDAPIGQVEQRLADIGFSLRGMTLLESGLHPGLVQDIDFLVLSAGVPRDHVALRAAIAHGIPVVSEIEVAAAHLPDATFLGITGTNGKSTTTTMLGAILRQADPQAFVGGNLGTPLCDALDFGAMPRLVALELSSYQLETIESLRLAAGIITGLAPDHLDRYPDVDAYWKAKANLLGLLGSDGVAILNAQDPNSQQVLFPQRKGPGFDFGVGRGSLGVAIQGRVLELTTEARTIALEITNERIVGHHNLMNAAAACAGALAIGLTAESCESGLHAWPGIEHRLERLGVACGLEWFNDSKATNVDAAVTALRSFASGVHLIAGGKGKGSSYAPLVETSVGRVEAVYVIGEDAEVIADAFDGQIPVVRAGTLENAVAQILARAAPGQTLLLAPACASFDQFPNYKVRGETLRRLFSAAGGAS